MLWNIVDWMAGVLLIFLFILIFLIVGLGIAAITIQFMKMIGGG
jgi:hypothetical protein